MDEIYNHDGTLRARVVRDEWGGGYAVEVESQTNIEWHSSEYEPGYTLDGARARAREMMGA